MASRKKYAYYIKGNQVAIVEENIGSGLCSISGHNTKATCEAAGGTWTENAFNSDDYGHYTSPLQTVTNGIELQYTYLKDTLTDEDTDVSLTRYQANALVYYLKAKAAEDIGDLDQREYFMREFKRQLGKAESALRGGIRIAQGFKGMRRK